MEGFSSNTRRTERRADLDLYVNKIVGDEPHLARVRDISASGMYLYKLLEPTYLSHGRFGVELRLPDTDYVIWAVAEVVRQESNELADGVAVRFVRIAEHDRELIRRYVDSAGNDDHEVELERDKIAYC